ncbi:hypothetical protein ACH4SP_11830 [Streptomyces sp. NPDC021093]|uniref:hypothetical protein n=1 Tax=Streptomyces sp. NPDC021093 TaxID=3365112 RepID=UPI0037964E3E
MASALQAVHTLDSVWRDFRFHCVALRSSEDPLRAFQRVLDDLRSGGHRMPPPGLDDRQAARSHPSLERRLAALRHMSDPTPRKVRTDMPSLHLLGEDPTPYAEFARHAFPDLDSNPAGRQTAERLAARLSSLIERYNQYRGYEATPLPAVLPTLHGAVRLFSLAQQSAPVAAVLASAERAEQSEMPHRPLLILAAIQTVAPLDRPRHLMTADTQYATYRALHDSRVPDLIEHLRTQGVDVDLQLPSRAMAEPHSTPRTWKIQRWGVVVAAVTGPVAVIGLYPDPEWRPIGYAVAAFILALVVRYFTTKNAARQQRLFVRILTIVVVFQATAIYQQQPPT